MSISLKTSNANEILESMVDTLNDSNFIGLYKKAEEIGGLREHKSPSIPTQPGMQELYNIAKKYLGYKGSDDKVNDFIEFSNDKIAQDKAKEYAKTHLQKVDDPLLNQFVIDEGISTVDIKPPQYDPSTMKHTPENVALIKEKLKQLKDEQNKNTLSQVKKVVGPANMADDVALAYTIKNLTKLANALDVNGYAGLANIVDKTISKVSSILNKKAMETGFESFDEEKKEELDKVKELLDMGDYSGAMMLIGKLGGVVEDVGDLGSSIEPKETMSDLDTSDLDFS